MMLTTIMKPFFLQLSLTARSVQALCAGAAIVLIAALLQAQTAPANAPKPAAPGPADRGNSKYQLQLPVPLVVEDILVLDHSGNPMHELKAADFTVTENGKQVTVRNFEEHSSSSRPAEPVKKLDLGPNVFTNLRRAPIDGSLNILLLDALNTPITDQQYVRQQMLKYLATLDPRTQIAVFGLSTRLYMLQGFTTDPELLRAAIEQKHKGLHASPLLDDPVSGGPVDQMSDTMADMLADDPEGATIEANLQQFEAVQQTEVARMRTIYTLQAMNELARYLSGLPGRKNLIWFSGSFPLNIFPDDTLQDPFAAVADFQDDVRKTTDLLARSRVAVYPVDGRGLFTNPSLSAMQSGSNLVRSMRTNPGAFAANNSKFLNQTAAEHATMDMIAAETGGKAFYNTNGLKEAVEKAVNYGENYYTISYTPPDLKWDGRYRKISVRSTAPGVHLSYRNGYYADDPAAAIAGNKVLPGSAMTAALLRGGPNATQILFDAFVVPRDETTDKLTTGAEPNSKLMKPPYRTYIVQYLVDLSGVQFTVSTDSVHHGALEFAAMLYTPDGEVVNVAATRLTLTLPQERFDQMMAKGLSAMQSIQAPVKGEYFLRMALHDPNGDRVGALEAPLTGLKTLATLRQQEAGQQGSQKSGQQPAPATAK
jgi:VWFA-related protein